MKLIDFIEAERKRNRSRKKGTFIVPGYTDAINLSRMNLGTGFPTLLIFDKEVESARDLDKKRNRAHTTI